LQPCLMIRHATLPLVRYSYRELKIDTINMVLNNRYPLNKGGNLIYKSIHDKFITHSQLNRIDLIYSRHEDRIVMKIFLDEIKGGNRMNKNKWIIGLSIASVLALSGTAFALNSGLAVAQSVRQTLGVASVPSSSDSNSIGRTTPGSNGFAGGYGMMGGQGTNGYGGGYGMMGGQGFGNNNPLDVKDETSAAKDMATSLTNATVDKSTNTITYTGTNVKIVMLGGPEEADGKFVIAGLINATLRIPKEANVTMELINEDKGMPHGVEITNAQPPYAYMLMMQGAVYPDSVINPIPEAATKQYPSAQVTFKAGYAGEFCYICQYPGHAAKGMFGKIIIG